jgi:Domain of unknown function (DUF4365)
MTSPSGKLRTRTHVLSDLSINYLERQIFLCGCSVQRVHRDYGYDLMMSTFKSNGEIEGGIVFFQVKSTDGLRLLADGQTVSFVVSRRDLRLWLDEAYPVILIIYDGRADKAVWLNMQAYFAEHSSADLFLSGETINVHVPGTNRLNRRSIQRIVQHKNAIHAQLQGKDRAHVRTEL